MKKFRLSIAGKPGHESTINADDRGDAAVLALAYLGFGLEPIPEPKANQLELALEKLGNEVMAAVNAPPA